MKTRIVFLRNPISDIRNEGSRRGEQNRELI
jgi:hypothetical protein